MKTPRDYISLVNKGVLTTEMIASVIYSLNKRAKNLKIHRPGEYRRAKRAQGMHRIYTEDCTGEKSRAMEYYRKKDFILLSLFTPHKIHLIDGMEYLVFRVHKTDFHFPGYMYAHYGIDMPRDLEVIEISDFEVQGEPVEKLLSVKFCNQVVDCIKSGAFLLIDGPVVECKTRHHVKIMG